MAVSANLFVTDSLVGSTQVKNTFANVNVGTRPFAFIGDQSFVIKLRRNSFEGDVIGTTPQITLRDNAALVSFVANTYTVSEGDLVEFTLTTTGAANNAVLYYSTQATTSNLTVQDFFGANTGSFTLVDNVGKIVLKANADGSLMNETGENFKLQIRTGSVTGNVVLVSDNVSILDTSNVSSFFFTSQSATSVFEGSNVSFTISSVNVPDGTVVFYSTAGNVRSYNFTTGNTGSFVVFNRSNTITLTPTAIPIGETRQFSLQIREGSTSGQIKATSQSVSVLDTNLSDGIISSTGGSKTISSGIAIHTFTSNGSLTLQVSGIANVEYLVVAGGGGGGSYGGGGGGGFRAGNLALTSNTYVITIGAGGKAGGGPLGDTAPGGSSSFHTIVSAGGGGGGIEGSNGKPGGSGGGAAALNRTGGTGNSPPVSPPQGFPGGNSAGDYQGAGGGGAGAAGSNAIGPTSTAGPGGNGRPSWITGSNVIYAGGGGGGQYNVSGPIGLGGDGGGGQGGRREGPGTAGTGPGSPGADGLGGGGGGSGRNTGTGGTGGSGIVIIRYPIKLDSTFALRENRTNVQENANIIFSVITTNVANNYILYYRTSGNVISSDFIGGNTGSFALVNNAANITLRANTNIPEGESRVFTFQILEGAVDGDVIRVSNTITLNSTVTYLEATGGTITTSGGYRIHSFTSSANLTISSLATLPINNTVDYLVVAGGGGGAPERGGGGGAGGFRTGNLVIGSSGTYAITVGAGGSITGNGNPSTFSTITSAGGGRGGGGNGAPGGSGGGASYTQQGGSGNVPPTSPPQGNPGGATPGGMVASFDGSSGGGGAGAAGQSTGPVAVGAGGAGAPSTITGINVFYAGGGGAGASPGQGPAPGGVGGGGAGGRGGGGSGGGINTGGGGGGGGFDLGSTQYPGAAGGSGIVIIRYPYQ